MVSDEFEVLFSKTFTPHPWHGVCPVLKDGLFQAVIEMVPDDKVKLELNKTTGLFGVDRPQLYSSNCPTPYGFLPQTYCGERVAARCKSATGLKRIKGDGDPLDICVITEKDLGPRTITLKARVIGGFRMIDKNEADDKIIAVLHQDVVYGDMKDISELPPGVLTRLRHYFLTYKQSFATGSKKLPVVKIPETYGAQEALEVIRLSMEDYVAMHGSPRERMQELRRILAATLAETLTEG
jgi:inorganic pyrophosphatase